MTYLAIDVANYLLKRSIETKKLINNLHLQKSLYYLQAYYLVNKYTPLFKESIEMWRLGPVVKEVYDEYKLFGSSNIDQLLKVCVFNEKTFDLEYRKVGDIDFDDDTNNTLNMLIDVLLEKDTMELIDMCLEEDLFKKYEKQIYAGERFVYSIIEMYDYFMEVENYNKLMCNVFELKVMF